MGIAADIVDFFHASKANYSSATTLQPKTVGDFLASKNWPPDLLFSVPVWCRKLCDAGLLISAGTGRGSPPVCECYYSYAFDEDAGRYGEYDFLVQGFPFIRDHFAAAVLAMEVQLQDGTHSIGTGFLLEDHRMLTARHCIEGSPRQPIVDVWIHGWDRHAHPLIEAAALTDDRADLALLTFDGDPMPGIPGFRLRDGSVLEDVLTIGYPQIRGFDSVLVAETAQVAGHLKSSTGQVVGSERSYLDGQPCYLITARVKGGSSGGPVIGKDGHVLGLVTSLPADSGEVDTLGFAVAVAQPAIRALLGAAASRSDHLQTLRFEHTRRGFRIL